MSDITLEQQKLLEPFGKMFAEMANMVMTMPDDELKRVLDAASATSTTNCWCYTFEAAKFVIGEVRTEMYQRKQRVANSV